MEKGGIEDRLMCGQLVSGFEVMAHRLHHQPAIASVCDQNAFPLEHRLHPTAPVHRLPDEELVQPLGADRVPQPTEAWAR